jgi:hypothetical protein
MAGAAQIREDMQVIGSDGGMIGVIDGVEGERLKLKRGPGGGPHHYVPLAWVARVDEHVHLDRPAAVARDTWMTESSGAGTTTGATSAGAASARVDPDPAHHRSAYGDKEGPVGSQRRAIPLLLAVAAIILATVFLMRSCDGPRDPSEPPLYEDASDAGNGMGNTAGNPAVAPGAAAPTAPAPAPQ